MFDFGIWLPRCFGYETEEKEKEEIFREILNRIFRGLKVKILKNVVKDKLKSRFLSTTC